MILFHHKLLMAGTLMFPLLLYSQVDVGEVFHNEQIGISATLITRFQKFNSSPNHSQDHFLDVIDSPKSVLILSEKNKFYVQNLEGENTLVFALDSPQLIKIISHSFNIKQQFLFQAHEEKELGYVLTTKFTRDVFKGKPVEACFSHRKKFLWVTYYRRSYDENAILPSALAIIDTDADTIVRVMATGPLPKMIAASPNGKWIAVTHWGDNTIGIINVDSDNPKNFKYIAHLVVDQQLKLSPSTNTAVNRDSECGLCLRGTCFSEDSRYLFVGRMGGGGIAVFETSNWKYLGTIWGMKTNVRHLIVHKNYLYLTAHKPGFIQRAPIDSIIKYVEQKIFFYPYWEEVFVGKGVRTMDISHDGKWIFAAVNDEKKIVVVDAFSFKIVLSCEADPFPVGLDYDENSKFIIVTSQGKTHIGGGNSIMLYKFFDQP
ncbi:MAG: hypothetical protein N2Z72_00065 [Bacteroidales bacterium]|nr:hypothetical protein [Bacteroidales bacterium]